MSTLSSSPVPTVSATTTRTIEPVSILVDSIHDFVNCTGGPDDKSRYRWYACKALGTMVECKSILNFTTALPDDVQRIPVHHLYPQWMDRYIIRKSLKKPVRVI